MLKIVRRPARSAGLFKRVPESGAGSHTAPRRDPRWSRRRALLMGVRLAALAIVLVVLWGLLNGLFAGVLEGPDDILFSASVPWLVRALVVEALCYVFIGVELGRLIADERRVGRFVPIRIGNLSANFGGRMSGRRTLWNWPAAGNAGASRDAMDTGLLVSARQAALTAAGRGLGEQADEPLFQVGVVRVLEHRAPGVAAARFRTDEATITTGCRTPR